MSWSFLSSSRIVVFHSDLEAEPLTQLSPHPGDINTAIFNHNGQVVATGGADGSVRITHIQKRLEVVNLGEQNTVV